MSSVQYFCCIRSLWEVSVHVLHVSYDCTVVPCLQLNWQFCKSGSTLLSVQEMSMLICMVRGTTFLHSDKLYLFIHELAVMSEYTLLLVKRTDKQSS